MKFTHPTDSHQHSLQTLNQLYEYDDFMFSIRNMVDLGCGTGEDLEWWSTRKTRDENPQPLEIQCTGVDLHQTFALDRKYENLHYQQADFEAEINMPDKGFDILWCHDSFQYALNPMQTLSQWWKIASPGAMLYICVPVTQRIYQRQLDYSLPSGCYYHYTLVNLIYMLATAGWDCRSGFFKQELGDSWIHAAVYKSSQAPKNSRTTTWYDLSEAQLLPKSADASVHAHGFLRQQDLVIPWLDQNLTSMYIR
jgi:ubiquinone/menaquinone biosynthesis C-methylase UbiE